MSNFDYKKSLGQNFLKDQNIINKISSSINPSNKDLVIEIGPGSGALTKELVKKDTNIICFEIDNRLESTLKELEKNNNNLKVIFKDFLSININDYIDKDKYEKLYFIGNLPYYITTAIINKIINETTPFEIVIMIQKEVADRFNAKPNTRDYGSISVFLQYNFDIEKICDVSKNCFEPVPKVDSSVIKFKSINKYKDKVKDEQKLYKLIKDSFTHKRKNLRNNLINYDKDKINEILKKYNKDLTTRAESLSIDEFIDISNNI